MAHLAGSTMISDCNGNQKSSKNSLIGPIFIFRNDNIVPNTNLQYDSSEFLSCAPFIQQLQKMRQLWKIL